MVFPPHEHPGTCSVNGVTRRTVIAADEPLQSAARRRVTHPGGDIVPSVIVRHIVSLVF